MRQRGWWFTRGRAAAVSLLGYSGGNCAELRCREGGAGGGGGIVYIFGGLMKAMEVCSSFATARLPGDKDYYRA